MAGIFISYRRDDAGGYAGRLYDRLCAHFGSDRVFRDVDTIAPGELFPRKIRERLGRSDVVVALIGKRWLEVADERGRRRIQQADDYLRMELALAFELGKPVIPILIDGASLPPAADLPHDLMTLRDCQAMALDSATFHEDTSRLIRALEPHTGARPERPERRSGRRTVVAASAALGLAAIAAAIAVAIRTPAEGAGLRTAAALVTADQLRASAVTHGFFSRFSNPAGRGSPERYRQEVVENGIVVHDAATGLTWQRGGSRAVVQGGRAAAERYVRDLNGRGFAGHTDWRLPTVDEALSIMSATKHGNFHLHPVLDPYAAPFIWTADDAPGQRGWVVYYSDGRESVERVSYNAYARAVRTEVRR